jgi:heme exporter protein A
LVSIKLCNITKDFGERRVLRNIEAEIHTGSSLAVVGKNGSGKSTLLKIIAGLLRPSSGKVVVEMDGKELGVGERRSAIGLVAPDLSLYDELTALENVIFFTKVRGIMRGEEELMELLGRVGLAGREHEPLAAYSSGMKQRMKYAFALLHDPPILLLDEPTANLDSAGIAFVDQTIKEYKRNGLLVLATNDQKEAEYGDQVIDLGV